MYPERAFAEVSEIAVNNWVKGSSEWWGMEVIDEDRAMWICKKCDVEYQIRVVSVASRN
jgi:hypothetical protein